MIERVDKAKHTWQSRRCDWICGSRLAAEYVLTVTKNDQAAQSGR